MNLFNLKQNYHIIIILVLFGGLVFNSLEIRAIKKNLQNQLKIVENPAVFSEVNTVFQNGKGEIGAIDENAKKITVNMINPNYAGGPKTVESVYQKKVLKLNDKTEIIALSQKQQETGSLFPVPIFEEKKIDLSALAVGDHIDFAAKGKFDFYATEEIEVERIIK